MATRISALNIDPEVKRLATEMIKDDAGAPAAVVADLAALRAAVVAITAKLDADAGVTDTNYAALTNPTANTATAVAGFPNVVA